MKTISLHTYLLYIYIYLLYYWEKKHLLVSGIFSDLNYCIPFDCCSSTTCARTFLNTLEFESKSITGSSRKKSSRKEITVWIFADKEIHENSMAISSIIISLKKKIAWNFTNFFPEKIVPSHTRNHSLLRSIEEENDYIYTCVCIKYK